MQQMSWSWSPVVGHILADAPTLFAHQGGWDEMLMVVVPVAAFAALLYGANRRAGQLDPHTPARDGDDAATPEASPETGRPPARTEPRNERGGPI